MVSLSPAPPDRRDCPCGQPDLDAFIARVQDSLGPNPTKEETVEATTAAMLALTEEERQSIDVDQLRRRLAVYRSVDFG